MSPLPRRRREYAVRELESLCDVPGLEALREVCALHQVELTCHGGTARRIAAATMASASESSQVDTTGPATAWSVFDCVPYNSDLDLLHSGRPEQTAAILEAIYRFVPFAEHIRWELRSRQEQDAFDLARAYAPIVPVLYISLSTHHGWRDPWNGLGELASGELSYQRNGFYRDSPRFAAGLDIELLQVLLFYKAAVERPEIVAGETSLAITRAVIAGTFRDVASRTRLEESAYLRSRLRYLLSAIKGQGGRALAPEAPLFESFGLGDIGPILEDLGGEQPLRAILNWTPAAGHLAVTSRMAGDLYRLPPAAPTPWHAGEAAPDQLRRALAESSGDRSIAVPLVADDQRIVVASPSLGCAPGIAPSSQDNEFLHFAIDAPDLGMDPQAVTTDLAVLCLVRDEGGASLLAVPTMCTRPALDPATLTLRCNVGRALNTSLTDPGRSVQLFVSQWQGGQSRLTEASLA